MEAVDPHDPVSCAVPPSVSEFEACVVILPKSATAPVIDILATMVVALDNVLFPEPEKARLKNEELAAMVWFPAAPKLTVPEAAVNTLPVPFQAVALTAFSLRELLPPFKLPAVSVTTPVKVCVSPTPMFNVPPVPLMVNPAPLVFPVNVAVPPVLVIETVPVVV